MNICLKKSVWYFSDAVKTLVGEENKRRGTIKMFEVLQDVRLNKQLFYVSFQSVFLIAKDFQPTCWYTSMHYTSSEIKIHVFKKWLIEFWKQNLFWNATLLLQQICCTPRILNSLAYFNFNKLHWKHSSSFSQVLVLFFNSNYIFAISKFDMPKWKNTATCLAQVWL